VQSNSKVINFFKSFRLAGDWADNAIEKINNLTETNYELGLKMAREGRNKDAIFRFRITLWLAPDHEPSMYNLACLYQHEGENQKALALLQKLIRANPKHANAIYRVACIDPTLLKADMRPQTVPPIQVEEYFNMIAPYYDDAAREENYKMPALLHQLLLPLLNENSLKRDLLDIGCGTGLCGSAFGGIFLNLVGVDVSAAMQEEAYRRLDKRGIRIYNQLIHQDIRHYLARPETPSYDLVICIDVLPYIGDLSLLSQQLAQKIRSGGMLAISFTPHPGNQNYGVFPKTGFFAHHLNYVNQCLNAQGFTTVRTGEVEQRHGEFAQLCFYQKQAHETNASSSDSDDAHTQS
jgi:predicted TPR repeat methyltransferase